MGDFEPQDRTSNEVESFYNDFSRKFIEDIVQRNDRVARQLHLFSKAIPPGAERILIIGFGSGQCAHFILTKVAQRAKITALDISSENLRLAQTLFPHPGIEYRRLDAIADPIEGQWDVIILPDVYEHIPIQSRPVLHSKINHALTATGRVVLTIPSPGNQDALRASGGLQIIDETVTLNDLISLAEDVHGVLTYFKMISVWQTDDYIHAVIERGADRVRSIGEADMLPLKGLHRRTVWTRGRSFLAHRLYLSKLRQALSRSRIQRILHKGRRAASDGKT